MTPRSDSGATRIPRTPAVRVAVMVESQLCAQGEALGAAIEALQTQVERDFAPVWGAQALVYLLRPDSKPLPTDWWLVVLDDEEQATQLGYADLTPGGYPLGKVFLKSSPSAGADWTVQVSHQLLELLADPDLSRTVLDPAGDRLLAMEVCDPVRAAMHGYEIQGVRVCNFVYPSWFQSFQPEGGRFDHVGLVRQPFELLRGGCLAFLAGGGDSPEWKEHAAGNVAVRAHAQRGSRRDRRGIAPSDRRRSTAHN